MKPTFRHSPLSCLRLPLLGLLLAITLHAQSTTPAVTQAMPAQTLAPADSPVTIDLRNYFGLPGVTGQIVQFNTVLGRYNVELLASAAPLNVANFLSYVNSSAYTNSIIHRSVPGFVIQGGGYTSTLPVTAIATHAPVNLEYNLPNTRGTIAMARTSDLNSATSQWFINTVDNTTTLGPSNGGGYTVFGRVLGTGMSVVDAIAAVTVWNAGSPFDSLPLRNYNNTQSVTLANLVTVNTVTVIPTYPTAGSGTAVLGFAATGNTNPSVVTAGISGSTLTLTPGSSPGTTTVTITATDTNGNAITGTVQVTVNAIQGQTINFGALADVPYGSAPITLAATASSGLPVSFTVVSGPGSLSGATLTLTGPGTVTVRASQAGNAGYHAAPSVDQSFSVLPDYLSWQQAKFNAGELSDSTRSGPNAVYGLDGLTNLVKYALGLEPKADVFTNLPATTTTDTDWVYTFTRPSSITDVTYAVEASTDLANWSTAGVTLEFVSTANGTDTWHARYPLASATKVYFRLKVTR